MIALLLAFPLAAAIAVVLRSCWRGDSWGLVTLALLCVVWLRVDKAFEGPVLVELTEGHGVVLADLVAIGFSVLGLIGWMLARPQEPVAAEADVDSPSDVSRPE